MKITHVFIYCVSCETKIEVLDEDREVGEVYCPWCGCTTELEDIRVTLDEEDF